MSAPTWDPQVYSRYADHRSRAFFDLVGRVDAEQPRRVLDLGCGTGLLTASLAERWPRARVLGIDNSANMLERAREYTSDRVSFAVGDLSTYLPPADADVIVSNAAYQWINDNPALIQRIGVGLRPGAWMAVQVPGNFRGPSHEEIRSLLAEPRWQDATSGLVLRDDPVLTAFEYGDALAETGLEVDSWETTYNQILTGPDPVLAWVKGTALRPILTRLSDPFLVNSTARLDLGGDLTEEFLTQLGARLRAAYPARSYGTVFPFRRIFVVAHRV